jgi:cystathionine gamma-synthase
MVSFEVDPRRVDVRILLRSTTVFTLAESLGGVESLIEQPSTMSHASMRPEARTDAGITDQVVRLSVGIEHGDDLVDDLARAFDSATRIPARRRHNGAAVRV